MTDKRFWYLVDKIGWHNSDYDIRRLSVVLLNHVYDVEEIKEMREISREKRQALDVALYEYVQKNPKKHYWGGDDSYWDFTAHIVGMGEEFYEKVKKSSDVIVELGSNYAECFEYVFTEAEYVSQTPEGKKILNKRKREKKLDRITNESKIKEGRENFKV